MRINSNMSALNTYRQLTANQAAGARSLERLSSGLRINRAGDDAAGLAISEKMRGQIRGLTQASRNAQDGISLIQTAEGALNETHSILQRMRELAVQASNDTNTVTDRAEIQKEVNQLTSEITRIGNNTEFNTKKVINGDMTGAGTGAVMERQTLSFPSVVLATPHPNVVLSIGGENYNIAFAHAVAQGTNTVDTATNTVTIGTATITDLGTNVASALNQLFGLEPSNSLRDFTITGTATNISIEAKSTGSFAGAAGAESIRLLSGLVAQALVQNTNGADGIGGQSHLQIGANQGQQFTVAISDMRALQNLRISGTGSGSAHGVVAEAFFTTTVLTDRSGVPNEFALDVSTASRATAAITVMDNAMTLVSAERSRLGAFQNRLEHTINNLGTSAENLTAAESRVRDVDMAKEMMEFTKNNILSQAAQAMLAQANQLPQGVLQLLR
ncbi:MAG: flagellin [Selenomonadales bacterium]|nr:flagellin [Selenomonadales bacterium]